MTKSQMKTIAKEMTVESLMTELVKLGKSQANYPIFSEGWINAQNGIDVCKAEILSRMA